MPADELTDVHSNNYTWAGAEYNSLRRNQTCPPRHHRFGRVFGQRLLGRVLRSQP